LGVCGAKLIDRRWSATVAIHAPQFQISVRTSRAMAADVIAAVNPDSTRQ